MNVFHSMVLLFFILIGVSIYFLQSYERGKLIFCVVRISVEYERGPSLWSHSQLLTDFERLVGRINQNNKLFFISTEPKTDFSRAISSSERFPGSWRISWRWKLQFSKYFKVANLLRTLLKHILCLLEFKGPMGELCSSAYLSLIRFLQKPPFGKLSHWSDLHDLKCKKSLNESDWTETILFFSRFL